MSYSLYGTRIHSDYPSKYNMNDEFQDLNSRIPDFNSALINRVTIKNTSAESQNIKPWVDPYQVMLQRKRGEPTLPPVQQWPENDTMALNNFCQKHGIVGISSRMNPKLVLMQLMRQVGDYTDVPMEDRVPEGYQRSGTISQHGSNYPYTEAATKKQIIHG